MENQQSGIDDRYAVLLFKDEHYDHDGNIEELIEYMTYNHLSIRNIEEEVNSPDQQLLAFYYILMTVIKNCPEIRDKHYTPIHYIPSVGVIYFIRTDLLGLLDSS